MDLLREWRRRIAGTTAVAIVIPVGIVAGALAIGVGGGFGGLGALGQAMSGPDIPGVEPTSSRSGSPDDEAGDLLAAAAARGAREPATAPRRAPGRRTTRRGDRPPGGSDRPTVAPTPDATRPPPPSSGGPDPTPPPEEPPSTVRQIGETVKGVTDQVPIAGEPAGQVVDAIVDTAEQLPLPRVPGLLP